MQLNVRPPGKHASELGMDYSRPKQPANSSPSPVLDIAFELSQLLSCGLDKETLALLVGLLEAGVSPEALAAVVKDLRSEAASFKAAVAAAAGSRQ